MKDYFKPLFGKDGGHYNIFSFNTIDGLKSIFPDGKADEMNVCLFSTSGVHGLYTTIEELEDELKAGEELGLTVLIIHPRLVSMKYGHLDDITLEDIPYLKKLRKSSQKALKKIGAK